MIFFKLKEEYDSDSDNEYIIIKEEKDSKSLAEIGNPIIRDLEKYKVKILSIPKQIDLIDLTILKSLVGDDCQIIKK